MKKKNIKKDEIIKEGSKIFGEFKDFIARGNVIDLAVGVVIGSAFGKIVTSIVNDILMPIIGIIIGGIDFSGLSLKIGSATVNYGMFIQNVIDFLIVAICIFFFIKIIERLTKKKEIKEEKVEEAKKDEQIVLLEEIRDLLKNLEKKYGNFKALNNLNIHIEKGSIYGLVGKNGAGKTTLIRLLCGLEEPTSGTYSIYRISNKDKNINKERQKIGAIIEYPYLYYNMNAYDNIKEVYKIKGITSYEEIDSLLDKVGLLKEKNKKVRTFSLGMKQRLMIACALVGNPDLLILDEPINGLDPEGIIEIRKLVLDLNKKSNITILISSHYLDELSKIATNYGFIDKGHIVEEISYEELNSKIREKTTVKIKDTDKLAEYLDDNNINYEKTGKEEITIYNKINIPKFITELNNNKIELEDIKEEKDTLENYFLKLLGGENE